MRGQSVNYKKILILLFGKKKKGKRKKKNYFLKIYIVTKNIAQEKG